MSEPTSDDLLIGSGLGRPSSSSSCCSSMAITVSSSSCFSISISGALTTSTGLSSILPVQSRQEHVQWTVVCTKTANRLGWIPVGHCYRVSRAQIDTLEIIFFYFQGTSIRRSSRSTGFVVLLSGLLHMSFIFLAGSFKFFFFLCFFSYMLRKICFLLLRCRYYICRNVLLKSLFVRYLFNFCNFYSIISVTASVILVSQSKPSHGIDCRILVAYSPVGVFASCSQGCNVSDISIFSSPIIQSTGLISKSLTCFTLGENNGGLSISKLSALRLSPASCSFDGTVEDRTFSRTGG
ncbi:hypothetical protein ALC62_12396 [Cyphomyrmex costatus]|uniref:Uncharacterized protein n=1 Tax=Cyphomyrmex costatus TaxID=456900 RepID=A0A151IB80_9HYME|nr:hypothetical protein ALC62_12396 [Cyphomyrmex costatus]